MKIDFSLAQLKIMENILGPLPGSAGGKYEIYCKITAALDSVKSRAASLEASIKQYEQDIASLKAELAAM